MKSFRGKHDLTIDAKGRLAVPAKFREVLSCNFAMDDDEEMPKLVMTLNNRECLLIYPEVEWERIENQLLGLNTLGNRQLQLYQDLMLQNAEELELDGTGRILIPNRLRRYVSLDKEVTLVGRSNRMELWNREAEEARTLAALDLDPAELEQALSLTGLRL